MEKMSLIKLVEEKSKENEDVLVTVDEFFKDRDYRWSFAANICSEKFDAKSFYFLLSDLLKLNNVQDIKILIDEIDDCGEGPYSDTLFLITSMNEDEIYNYFGEVFPSEISIVRSDDGIINILGTIRDEFKAYCLWWD